MTVSVLIPAYNAAETLPQTLAALKAQTRPADEIVVCDDGSTDATSAIAASVAGIRVIRQPNGGVSVARNTLLRAATAEIILFCDADDLPHADWIATLAGRIESDGSDVALCGLRAGRRLDEIRYVYPCRADSVVDGRAFYRQQLDRTDGGYSYLPCCAFRRELVCREPVLTSPVGLKVQEDECLMLKLARRSRKVSLVPRALYDYVYRETSACAVHFRSSVGKPLRRQYAMRDWDKFKTSRRIRYLLSALKNGLQAL